MKDASFPGRGQDHFDACAAIGLRWRLAEAATRIWCLLGCSLGTPGSPRFPLKGSLKGVLDIGIDMDVDILDTELDAHLRGPYRAY